MSLLQQVQGVLTELPATSTPGDIAEAIAAIGSVYALRFDDDFGDVAAERLPMLADRWGVGASAPRAARKLIERRPDCLIGIRHRSTGVVVDAIRRTARPEREIVKVERGWK